MKISMINFNTQCNKIPKTKYIDFQKKQIKFDFKNWEFSIFYRKYYSIRNGKNKSLSGQIYRVNY